MDFQCAGVRQLHVMSVYSRVGPMSWETGGSQTPACYVPVWLTLQYSAPPTVHTPSADVHR